MTAVEAHRDPAAASHPLDNPAWASLSGPHRRFAQGPAQDAGEVRALRYPPEVSPITALAAFDDPLAWAQLAALAGPGQSVFFPGPPSLAGLVPAGWTVTMQLPGIQLTADPAVFGGPAAPDPELERLGPVDVGEMLDLVKRTEPGPFEPRTVELGSYLGIRRQGALVAMAGERMHPPGYTEISAVCTDPAFRGQGLAARLVRAVAQGIAARGETPVMHAAAGNTRAVELYRRLGFEIARRPTFYVVRTPGTP